MEYELTHCGPNYYCQF